MNNKNPLQVVDVDAIKFDGDGAYEIREIKCLDLLDQISGGRGGVPWGADIDINFCWGSNSGCSSTPPPPRPPKPPSGEEGDDSSDYDQS